MAEPRAPELIEFRRMIDIALDNPCWKSFCTTCGGMQHRLGRALLEYGGSDPLHRGAKFYRALTIDPRELASIPLWQEIALRAFLMLPFKGQQDDILSAWLPHATESAPFLDRVLFTFVRHYPANDPMRARWVELGFERAVQTRDESLVETVIAVERSAVLERTAFIALATALAQESPRVAKAFRRAGIPRDRAGLQ